MRFHNEACAVPNPAIRDFTEISIRLSCLKPQRRLKMRNESQFATTLSGDAPASSVASSELAPPSYPANRCLAIRLRMAEFAVAWVRETHRSGRSYRQVAESV